jgi:hypothetical protein
MRGCDERRALAARAANCRNTSTPRSTSMTASIPSRLTCSQVSSAGHGYSRSLPTYRETVLEPMLRVGSRMLRHELRVVSYAEPELAHFLLGGRSRPGGHLLRGGWGRSRCLLGCLGAHRSGADDESGKCPARREDGQPARDALFADSPWTPPTRIAIFRGFRGFVNSPDRGRPFSPPAWRTR